MGQKYDSTDDKRLNVSVTGGEDNNVMRHQYRVLTDEDKANMKKAKDLGLELWTLITNEAGPVNYRDVIIEKGNTFQDFICSLATDGSALTEELNIALKRVERATTFNDSLPEDKSLRAIAVREAVMWAVQHVTR